MVSLKVLQLELSPPHTPHLSSCFEEPNTPSQPTFCWHAGGGRFHLSRRDAVALRRGKGHTHLTLPAYAHAVGVLV